MKRTFATLAVLMALPVIALAQKPVSETEAVETTATIEAIDHSARLVTLKGKNGNVETIYAGPDIKRFDELKVGDTVTFRYYESVAYQIRKAGQPGAAQGVSEPTITRSTGPRPGGTVAQQATATVTIKAVDAKVPSVTVLTDDGRTLSFKVADKKKLEGLKAGDKVEITYTQAFVVSVK